MKMTKLLLKIAIICVLTYLDGFMAVLLMENRVFIFHISSSSLSSAWKFSEVSY